MKVFFAVVGKTREKYIREGVNDYTGRIRKYVPFEYVELQGAKLAGARGEEMVREKESAAVLKFLSQKDCVVLLDEHGEPYSSADLALFLQKKMNSGIRSLVFIAGGPYGFGIDVLHKADNRLSLSRMTFSHQMVRLIFLEQLYRAFTILRNEPYHHA